MVPIIKSVILAVFFATAALSQQDCPNPVQDCPDVCEGEQCDRFLNAECQVNPCNGECTPSFIWRGKDVTRRCEVRRCRNRVCPGRRPCVERIMPEQCPLRSPNCRQYINARCIFPRNCEQLSCEAGTICRETIFGIPQCVPSIAISCDELKCPRGTVCVSQGIPSRGLSVAQCLKENEASSLPTANTFFCNSGATICTDPVGEACIDIYDGGRLFLASCLQIGCDVETNSPCIVNRVCTAIPDRPFTTACIGSTSILGTNCSTDDSNRCPNAQNCRETIVDDKPLFSTCGITADAFTGPSCEALECPMPLVCNDLESVEGGVGLARCAGPEFTDTHEATIQALLNEV